MFRSLSLTLLVVLLIACVPACVHQKPPMRVSGTLLGETVWQGVVHLVGDVILPEGSRLTIRPGTRVVFLPATAEEESLVEHPYFPGSELIIRGRVSARGTAAAPIRFEALDPQAPAGSWGAVNIEGSREAVFEYCVFRQADSAVHSRDATVYIEESLFENNLVGVRFHSSEILIENNLLRDNGAALRFHFGAPVICNNLLYGNRINLFVTAHPRDYHIENNSFGRPSDYQVVLGEEVPEDVDLQNNYWYTLEPGEVRAMIYDGERSPYLGKVTLTPLMQKPSGRVGLTWTP